MRPLHFGPYALFERIGVGARSEVFRAARRDGAEAGRFVALKRVLAGAAHDLDTQQTLAAEAELLSALSHPGVVRVVDHGVVSGVAYVAYELVDGVDLEALSSAARSDARARIGVDVALSIAIQVCEALAYVHTCRPAKQDTGVIHRDVCPSNVLLARDGAVKLADFGIAKVSGRASTTGVGEIKGTVRYMSPEQVRGERLDGRSDLYSLTAVLFELLLGAPLFEGRRPVEVLQLVSGGKLLELAPIPADLPGELRDVLRKGLASMPGERYDTAAQLLEALRRATEKLGVVVGQAPIARLVGALFPTDRERSTWEESRIMADEKGGSDLDVFEGLAKKSSRQSSLPGGPASVPAPSAKQSVPAPVPPPSMKNAKTTLLGVPAPLPPPASAASSAVPPPSIKPAAKTPPPPAPPGKSSSSDKIPSAGAVPPPSATATPLPKPASAPPPPPPKAPSTLVAAVAPPPKPPVSIGSAVGMPSATPAAPESAEENTPPAGTKKKKSSGANVDMDWEDEEESTHVFEKQKHAMNRGPRPAAGEPAPQTTRGVGAAAALVSTSSTSAAPPQRTAPPMAPLPAPAPLPMVSAPPAPSVQAPAPVPAVATPLPMRRPSEEPTVVRQSSGSKAGVILGGLALVAVVGLAVFMFLPRTGQLKIDLKAKSGNVPSKAEIFVDGQKRCDTAPCVVDKLDAGSHSIKVIVGDSVTTESTNVESGKERSISITLEDGEKDKPVASSSASSSATAAPVSAGTGLKVSGPAGVKILVDGKERGQLGDKPVMLTDLTPGDHKLKIDGGERYESSERTVAVSKDKIEDLGEIKPKVIKGKLTIEIKTDGAQVTLTGNVDGKKVEKKFDKAPGPINLETKEPWKLTATKKGFEDFSQDLKFEDGVAEKTITIELTEKGKAPAPGPGPGPGPGPTTTTTATATSTPPPSGNGTLSMNSIPVSKVVLDGRPLGNTPQTQSVSAGKHTVMFIHPDKGKKTVSVDVKPGQKAVASAKF